MKYQVGDKVILTKTGQRGTIDRKGPFGWFVRFGEWEHYPVYDCDLELEYTHRPGCSCDGTLKGKAIATSTHCNQGPNT